MFLIGGLSWDLAKAVILGCKVLRILSLGSPMLSTGVLQETHGNSMISTGVLQQTLWNVDAFDRGFAPRLKKINAFDRGLSWDLAKTVNPRL